MMGPGPERPGSNVAPFLGPSTCMEKIFLRYNLSMARFYFAALLFLAAGGVMPDAGVCAQGVRPLPAARNFNIRSAGRPPIFVNSLRTPSFSAGSFSRLAPHRGAGISAAMPHQNASPSLYTDIRGGSASVPDNSLKALLGDRKSLSVEGKDEVSMPAGQLWSRGVFIMDRVLGVKSAASEGEPVLADLASQNHDALRVAKNGAALKAHQKSAREKPRAMPGVIAEDLVGKTILFGAGAFSLSGTIESFGAAGMLAVYFTMILPSLVLHEMGHAKAAEILGDPTPRLAGRLEWSWSGLRSHVHWLWSMVVPLAFMGMVGAARPVLANENNFRHPVYDLAKTALAGPAVNAGLALAGAAAFGALTAAGVDGFAVKAVGLFASLNGAIALLNLVPLFPMDGKHVLAAVLHAVHPGLRAGLEKIYDRLGILGAIPLVSLLVLLRAPLRLKAEAFFAALLTAASSAFGFLFS